MSDEKKPLISRDDPDTQPVTQAVVSRWQRRDQLVEFDFKLMNLGRLYRGVKAKGIQDEDARNTVINYCHDIVKYVQSGNGFVFTGEPGVGKSAAAAIIAMEARRWTFTVRVTFHEELQELQFNDRPFDDSMSMMERIRAVDLLVLDNFNEDFIEDNRFGPKHMEKLVTRRQADGKVTMLTTRIPGSSWGNDRRLKSLWGVFQGTNIGVTIEGENLRQKSSDAFQARIKSRENK
jgi:hypothetical protein